MTNEQLKKIRAIVFDAYCEGDTDAEALLPILDAAREKPEQEPVARVTGYYAGRCVIEPLDGKTVFSPGMAVYSAPPATQSAQEPIACKHNRYSVDVHEQTGTCYDCGAEGRMRFVVDDTAPPPSREWQSLTDDEIDQCIDAAGRSYHRHKSTAGGQQLSPADAFDSHLAWAVQQALRAKNTGER